MVKVVVFGTKDLAQLAKYYLDVDSPHKVVAFTVNEQYMPETCRFEGLPVVPFEGVTKYFSPADYKFFAPMTGAGMNKRRADIYHTAKGAGYGYEFISYVSSKATVCHNKIGDNCFILEDNTLQPFAEIGNNVVMWSGNHIGHHGSIGDHTFFTSHVVLSGHCKVEPYSWFGVNATIRDGLTIAEGTLVAMGALLTKSTDAWSAYLGVPAKKLEKGSLEVNP